jgi:hypothetical protein
MFRHVNTCVRALWGQRSGMSPGKHAGKGLLEFRRGRGVTVASTSERGAVVVRAKELVEFARSHGYQRDELIEIIETVG